MRRLVFSILLAAVACGDEDGAAPNPDDASPTRRCVLLGTCSTCYSTAEDECWEGFQDCDDGIVEGYVLSSETCPDVGFPVNCSGQNKFYPESHRCERPNPNLRPSNGPGSGCACQERLELCETHADCIGDDICAHEVGPDTPKRCYGQYSGGDACSECLSSCRGLPSCCTGVGCLCESEC